MKEDIKCIICPDIHGRNFWEKPQNEYDGSVPFIFLGDYMDPYAHEGITEEQCKSNFIKIWKLKEKYDNNVILLLGNHDVSYYDFRFRTCRYCNKIASWYSDFLKENWHHFKFAHEIKNNDITFLFSHAGVHPRWFEQNNLEKIYNDDYINSLFISNKIAFNDISIYRGGYNIAGSPIWADIREYSGYGSEFDEHLKQIVGHTMLNVDKYETDNVICIDSQQPFIITKTNEIIKY
jgi:hypothetical protein